jgi:carboxynorspermidine decarboxylase
VFDGIETPSFIIDERRVLEAADAVRRAASDAGAHLLYAMKAQANGEVLRTLAQHVSGFAASSLFEAELARSTLSEGGSVHMTTPGFRPDEIPRLDELCDYVALNTLSQLHRFAPGLKDTSVGLRVNPEYSFVKDARYDPCRKHSKLGVPLRELVRTIKADFESLRSVQGLHFHSNCESQSLDPLLKTVRRLSRKIDPLLRQVSWVNLGGGYLFPRQAKLEPLREAVALLTERYGVEVYIEPGRSLVGDAGYLVSTVIDVATSGRETLAYLDTSVNHMPEVYEYQYEPNVVGHTDKGTFRYRLVGSTCLAGDMFGSYSFDAPLEIGSRVVFADMGAYASVKAHMFNGINLPTTYWIDESGEASLQKRFTYQDFANNCGEPLHARI